MFEMYDFNLVSTRLSKAIIRIDGKYIYVASVDTVRDGYVVYDLDGKCYHIGDKIAKIEYDSMPIGMVMLNGTCYWSFRNSVRKWKVGIHSGNYCIRSFGSHNYNYIRREMYEKNIRKILDMLKGVFWPVHTAVEYLDGCPISQRFACRQYNLVYKTWKVGKVNEDFSLTLEPKYEYLTERLNKELKCNQS